MNKSQKLLEKRIKHAYIRKGGFSYKHPDWDDKLWKKSAADIHEFLDERFRNTLDTMEYYACMVLLYRTVKKESLLIEFHDSPQYIKMIGTYNHPTQNKTSIRMDQNPSESIATHISLPLTPCSIPNIGGMK